MDEYIRHSAGQDLFFGAALITQGATWFFFFQAEDGIRDDLVTGVQTCALPISTPNENASGAPAGQHPRSTPSRSEERRVGKECRSRGLPYRYTNKPCHSAA